MPGKSVALTALGKRILSAAADRVGGSESDIVEHLLRLHGGEVTPEEFAPIENDAAA